MVGENDGGGTGLVFLFVYGKMRIKDGFFNFLVVLGNWETIMVRYRS